MEISTHRYIKETAFRETALPGAGSDLISIPITPVRAIPTLRVSFTPGVTGILTATYTLAGNTRTDQMFGGETLAAGIEMWGDITPMTGETVNFTFSNTGGNYSLSVREM